MDSRRQVDVRDPAVALQDFENLAVNGVNYGYHGLKMTISRTNLAPCMRYAQGIESTFRAAAARLVFFPTTVERPMSATPLSPASFACAPDAPQPTAADLEPRYGAANYHPLPVTLQRGAG